MPDAVLHDEVDREKRGGGVDLAHDAEQAERHPTVRLAKRHVAHRDLPVAARETRSDRTYRLIDHWFEDRSEEQVSVEDHEDAVHVPVAVLRTT